MCENVFSREESSNIVTSCTGTIISTQLILTSSHCLMNATTGGRLSEFVVTVQSLRRPKTLPAEVVEIGDTWGILKIPEMTLSTYYKFLLTNPFHLLFLLLEIYQYFDKYYQ
ncbi:unnamed protein product [Onchocerca flexuosa]|uniref:Peptidase S1 domain-containing protein n=1 Tax=Onchocerca flexuosa TaxID=387005 RepID=A0A183HPH0_9BILA|nr:unnamed protein product [Onchocerca flexuosa]